MSISPLKKKITNTEKKRNQSVIRGSFVGSENRMWKWVTWCSSEQWDSMNTVNQDLLGVNINSIESNRFQVHKGQEF